MSDNKRTYNDAYTAGYTIGGLVLILAGIGTGLALVWLLGGWLWAMAAMGNRAEKKPPKQGEQDEV